MRAYEALTLAKGFAKTYEGGNNKGINGFFILALALCEATHSTLDAACIKHITATLNKLIEKLGAEDLAQGFAKACEAGSEKGSNGFWFLARALNSAAEHEHDAASIGHITTTLNKLIDKLGPEDLAKGFAKTCEGENNKGINGIYVLAHALFTATLFKLGAASTKHIVTTLNKFSEKLALTHLVHGFAKFNSNSATNGFYDLNRAWPESKPVFEKLLEKFLEEKESTDASTYDVQPV